MKIKRILLHKAMGDKTMQKAIALALLFKHYADNNQCLRQATCYKLAKMVNASTNTISKYLPIMERSGLIERQGRCKDIIVVKNIVSRTKHRNMVLLKKLDFSSFKNLFYSFRALLFIVKQSYKEYLRRMLRLANRPTKFDSIKKIKRARNFCKRYAKNGIYDKFNDLGISYKKIGETLGYCERTAERIVKDAISKKWCKKQTHYNYTYMPKVNYRYVEGYTFTTKDYGFVVSANTYKLSHSMVGLLIDGKF